MWWSVMTRSILGGVVLAVMMHCTACDDTNVSYSRMPVSDDGCVDLVKDCGAKGSGLADDSRSFILCQELATRGCVTVPPGTYAVIAVKINRNNTIWKVHPDVIFVPAPNMTRCDALFYFGSSTDPKTKQEDTGRYKNISMTSSGTPGSKFTVDISRPQLDPWNVRGFMILGGISDFTLANCFIKMADPGAGNGIKAAKSGIEFGNANNSRSLNPSGGLIENITSIGGTFGYGMIQTQSVESTTFNNLDGTGGVTLRLETGVGKPGAYVGDISAKNITCRNGKNAVMVVPHQQDNGDVFIEGVQSFGCLSALSIGAGYYDPNRHPGLKPGWYGNKSKITDVTSFYGKHAQATANISNYPACTACQLGWPDGSTKWSNYTNITRLNWEVQIDNIKTIGYPKPSNRSACIHWVRFVNGSEQLCPYKF